MDLVSFQKKHLPQVEACMTTFLKAHTNQESLLAAMNYSLQAGGKRIRPLILLLCSDFLGQSIGSGHYAAAASLEMIHTYSLIHDDLPAMDDDDLRRGKPTNHKVFGDALAILAGDGLLTAAFQLLASAPAIMPETKLQLLQKLAEAAGTEGMVAGQVADIEGEEQHLPLPALQQIHARKTGALLRYAAVAAGILGNGQKPLCQMLEAFGAHFGVAFQIRDDLLDVLGDEAELGKKVGMDARLHKSTYPALLGLRAASDALFAETAQARQCLAEIAALTPNCQPEKLSALVTTLEKI